MYWIHKHHVFSSILQYVSCIFIDLLFGLPFKKLRETASRDVKVSVLIQFAVVLFRRDLLEDVEPHD